MRLSEHTATPRAGKASSGTIVTAQTDDPDPRASDDLTPCDPTYHLDTLREPGDRQTTHTPLRTARCDGVAAGSCAAGVLVAQTALVKHFRRW
jgi:hypothetical protein